MENHGAARLLAIRQRKLSRRDARPRAARRCADKPISASDSNCDGIDGTRLALFVAPGRRRTSAASISKTVRAVIAALRGKESTSRGIYDGKVTCGNGNIGLRRLCDDWQRSDQVTTLGPRSCVPSRCISRWSRQASRSAHELLRSAESVQRRHRHAQPRDRSNTAPGAKRQRWRHPDRPPVAAPDGLPGAKRAATTSADSAAATGYPGMMSGGTGGEASEPKTPEAGRGLTAASDLAGVQGRLGRPGPRVSRAAREPPDFQGTDGQGGSAALNYASLFYQAMQGRLGQAARSAPAAAGRRRRCAAGEACRDRPWSGGAGGYPGEGGMGSWGGGGLESGSSRARAGGVVLVDGRLGDTARRRRRRRAATAASYPGRWRRRQGRPGARRVDRQHSTSSRAPAVTAATADTADAVAAARAELRSASWRVNAGSVIDEDTGTKITVGAGGAGRHQRRTTARTECRCRSTQVTTAGGSIPGNQRLRRRRRR